MSIYKKIRVAVILICAGWAVHGKGRQVQLPSVSVSVPAFAAAIQPDIPKASEGSALNIFVSLSQKVIPSVVNISTLTAMRPIRAQESTEDLFHKFFGGGLGGPSFRPNMPSRRLPKAAALGTGFIIDSSGVILTNNHVVAGADEIKVQFTESSDEKATEGKVIGRDPDLDVALIRVNTSRKLISLPLGDSESLQVGEYVMAVGNPYGNGHSVSHGIVSAKGRVAPGIPLASYLQIDAPINPGNSGGPLLNLKGEVVGINNAIDARAQGIGFAIPINYVKKVLNQLEVHGRVDRGYIGAVVGPLTPEVAEKIGVNKDLQAPFVTQVNPGTPAANAGLQLYDVIVAVDGASIHSPNELVLAITSVSVGKMVPLKINRNGKEKTLLIETVARPGQSLAATDSDVSSERDEGLKAAGLHLQNLPLSLGKGLLVKDIDQGSPGEVAGIRPGDVILEVDRKEIAGVKDFAQLLKNNKSYLLRVKRNESEGLSNYSVVILDLNKNREEK